MTDEDQDATENEEEHTGRPSWMSSRVGHMPGGPQPLENENIPDWAWESPEYWYARYVEIEKAYRDLAQMNQQQNWQSGTTAMSLAHEVSENEDLLDEILGLSGIAVSIATVLFALRGGGHISISPGVILGISFAGMVLAQRIQLPEALGKVKEIITPPYSSDC
ncbi:hypothetical protein B4589_009380 [Halolamina sp. CBA1230]|uniref:hypothetical protein n=1 Tax=Halolamina sp. CBA1230 TaxID=1853690 RepID=UPI00117B8C7F|nr:hypothetical protein [Halolamina sp. CBA1230]QKY20578.1 hypothetical protein B4589_009380 [Halolamina sp. CBA1230]